MNNTFVDINNIFPKDEKKEIKEEVTYTEEKYEETENPLNGMKFLAVEDNDINADILTELLAMEGASVIRCVNGQDAVEKVKSSKEGDFDMILMDIQMPVMNGYEATILIRGLKDEWAQKIPIIAMTANAFDEDRLRAYEAGMNAILTNFFMTKSTA